MIFVRNNYRKTADKAHGKVTVGRNAQFCNQCGNICGGGVLLACQQTVCAEYTKMCFCDFSADYFALETFGEYLNADFCRYVGGI